MMDQIEYNTVLVGVNFCYFRLFVCTCHLDITTQFYLWYGIYNWKLLRVTIELKSPFSNVSYDFLSFLNLKLNVHYHTIFLLCMKDKTWRKSGSRRDRTRAPLTHEIRRALIHWTTIPKAFESGNLIYIKIASFYPGCLGLKPIKSDLLRQ